VEPEHRLLGHELGPLARREPAELLLGDDLHRRVEDRRVRAEEPRRLADDRLPALAVERRRRRRVHVPDRRLAREARGAVLVRVAVHVAGALLKNDESASFSFSSVASQSAFLSAVVSPSSGASFGAYQLGPSPATRNGPRRAR
jgi:hypothetical protein